MSSFLFYISNIKKWKEKDGEGRRLLLRQGTGGNASYAGNWQVYVLPLADFYKGSVFKTVKEPLLAMQKIEKTCQ